MEKSDYYLQSELENRIASLQRILGKDSSSTWVELCIEPGEDSFSNVRLYSLIKSASFMFTQIYDYDANSFQ